jgi:hypothetical protein
MFSLWLTTELHKCIEGNSVSYTIIREYGLLWAYVQFFKYNTEMITRHTSIWYTWAYINLLPSRRDLYSFQLPTKVNPSRNCNYSRNRTVSYDIKYAIFSPGATENSNFINSTPFCRKTATRINANVTRRLQW